MSTETDEDKLQCESLQEDELAVLESMYPEQVTILPNPRQKPGRLLTLHLPITLPSPTTTHFATTASGPSATTLTISHLPPLVFRLILPPLYPLSDSPRPLSLKAQLPDESGGTVGNWLPKALLRRIEAKLGEMWVEEKEVMGGGTGVLWKWWEWVVNGDFLADLSMVKSGTLELPVPPMITASTFFTILKAYNSANMHSEFERTAFSCTICWENRKGSRCVQMPGCGCVFCSQCLKDCWTLAVTEGTLESVACPSPACVKRRATRDASQKADDDVDPELVESVVGKELRVRWEELKQRRIVETGKIPDVLHLSSSDLPSRRTPSPLPSSPTIPTSSNKVIRLSELSTKPSTPAPAQEHPPPPITTEDRWEAYRLCPKCNFSFCLYCSCTWHGPHTVCALPATSELVREYLSYAEGSEERARIEVQRGKSNMERMVARWQEDELNRKWLEESTSACPGCGVRVEKSHGCNHMTCGRCQAHFCYRCGESIRPTDPYRHFNTPGKPCYMKLFVQDDGNGLEYGGGAAVIGGDEMVVDLPLIQQGDEGFNWRDFREGGRFAEW